MYNVCIRLRFEWDDVKRAKVLSKHGFDFRDVESLFEKLQVTESTKLHHRERRFAGQGFLDGIEVIIIFTVRDEGRVIRVITMRKAHRDERKKADL
jgi:uncharacterized DUF497 family protein